ncbi:MAG: ABC transporter ATP-binding protein [Promethearchaeota archaeon]
MIEMLLECKDLIKVYPSPVEGLKFPALRGLNLSVEKGDLIAIIGPSGAGKTTLFRLISAFEFPSSGEIWFDGQLVNNFSIREQIKYRQKIGVMYQLPSDNLLWGLSALQNVLLPMRYSGKFLEHQKERAYELLERVGLKGKEKREPPKLSGGEQQRVAIAVALANGPELLLADEPTGELDSHTTGIIIDYLKELNRETGTTIMVATHDKRFSQMTKAYKIQDGRITTYQVTLSKLNSADVRHEVAVVDSQGNLRIPMDILAKYKGLSAVEIIEKDGRIELLPFEYVKKQEKEKKEDLTSSTSNNSS